MIFQRCKKCVIPTTRPDTAFVDGVCSACINFADRKSTDWSLRERALKQILKESAYRVIVPSSGGKDSHWQVLKLLELGADVTIVTASTCHLTKMGRRNIENLKRYARTIEISPNTSARAKLNRLGLELVGDISWPEHISIHRAPFRIARDLGIPLIFYGECPNEAYGGPLGTEGTREMTQRWAAEFGGFLGLRPQDLAGHHGLTTVDMSDYLAPNDEKLTESGVKAYFLGQFYPWDSHRNANAAIDAGMLHELPSQANWWPWENLDNAQTGLHDHMMYRKYGYGRLSAQISVDIRMGLVAREAAMRTVENADGLFPFSYAGVKLEEMLRRIGMDVRQLWRILDRFTNEELFGSTENERPILKEFFNKEKENEMQSVRAGT